MIIGVILVLLLIFGGIGFAMYYAIKKTDPNNLDKSVNPNIDTTQNFIPFEDIKDGVIHLGGHRYRAIIECSSTNYNLKTEKEKEIIEVSYQRFLNSLTFPISIFIQTKVIDNSKMLESLKSDIEEVIKEYPYMAEYADNYLKEMANLYEYIGNNKQKKKYIIVPYEEALNLTNLSDEEKYDYSINELYKRCLIIIDNLTPVGIKCKILNTKEIVELIYSIYHRDNYSDIDALINGEYTSLLVNGENKLEKLNSDAKLDLILYEAEEKIKNDLIDRNVPDFIKDNAVKVIEELEKIRDVFAGYYKDDKKGGELS